VSAPGAVRATAAIEADVAIVGRGIAAAAAALTLAGSGRSVVMVGLAAGSGARVGDSLSPAANALLKELGLAEAFAAGPHRPAQVTYAAWGAPLLAQRNAIVHAEGPGHVLDRRAFDRMLTEAAEQTVRATIPDMLAGAARTEDGWLLTLRGGARLAARFVLDCSGRAAAFGRTQATRRRADRLVAAYSFLQQQDDGIEPTPATLIEAVPDGWWYAALLPDRRLSLAYFSDADLLPRGLSRDLVAWRAIVSETQFIRRWLESAGFALTEPPRLASAATCWLEPVAGPGWAAAGDAAAAFDPLSSHGLTSALWGGRRVAQACLAALDGDAEPLMRYATTVDEAVQSFLVQRQAVYTRERRFLDQPFWQRRISTARPDRAPAEIGGAP
jgi:2-polyprenyl-6-methoxyphenol hydroxylase-like FAD-dependent oxidoreductase